MRIDRLFHVLVVHGGLLVVACDEGKKGPVGDDGADDGADDASDSADDASDDAADDAPATDDGPAQDDGSSGEPPSSSEGGIDLSCSPQPDPTDTCGCPCCWATDCINTDECCGGFTELCTPSA